MSIQYTVLGFELTTFGTQVSSHNQFIINCYHKLLIGMGCSPGVVVMGADQKVINLNPSTVY